MQAVKDKIMNPPTSPPPVAGSSDIKTSKNDKRFE
jgi:hypothetical protein